ncbi:MAG TPA: ABC transporter ATP-binding protein [Mycobacteriales bacterium]|nr:ABC transporter ATP-binding protein [Mycobacteriales bacterium]
MTEVIRPPTSLRAARRMLAFAWAADRKRSVLILVLLTVQTLGGSLFALWLGLFVDGAVAGHRTTTLLAGLAIAASIAAVAGLDYASARVRMALSDRTHLLLERRLLEMVGRTPTLAIQETPAHLRQLELLQDEAWQFGEAVPSLIQLLNTAVRVLITAVLLASISPLLLLLPLFGLPALLLAPRSTGLYSTGNELAAEPSRRATMLYDLVADRAAAKEIRLFRLQSELLSRFAAEHRTIRDIHVSLQVRGQLVGLMARTVFLVGYLGSIVLVAHRAATGAASVGDVVLTAVLAGQVLGLVTGSAELTQWVLRTLTAAGRFVYLEDATDAAASAAAAGAGVPDRLSRGIRLAGVSFGYPGRSEPILRDVDLELPAGATIAIVGDNGAGKSTLVKLLAGLCTPTAGRIEVDGVGLSTIDLNAWRLRVSAGFQDHARFEFSVQRTVGIGDLPAVDDPAAARDGLDRAGATDLLDALPAGLATQLGPRWPEGIDLSGGQWQKLAIGRAMMRTDPLLLLLDEPTAAIDAESEHHLFARWTEAAQAVRARSGAITVLVSHRFSTVRMADLIVVLRDGGVAEQGSHDELIAADGLYAELFELQARAYR